MNAQVVLLILAFLCALLSTFRRPIPRVNLTAAALAFYFASLLLPALR